MREIPEIPTGFLKDQKELWEKVWRGNQHLVPQRDLLIVQMYCETWSEYRTLMKLVKKERLITHPNLITSSHPHVAQLKEVKKDFAALTKELGLSPLSAAALSLVDPAKAERAAELQQRPSRESIVAKAKGD